MIEEVLQPQMEQPLYSDESLKSSYEQILQQQAIEYEEKIEQYQQQIEQQKRHIHLLETSKARQSTGSQVEMKPDLKTLDVKPVITPMSKVQMYNSVRRYLSTSMAILLRMEMFGSSEREWKTDEKQLAIEILSLGTDVYDHLVEEWRLRLPTKSVVQQWSDENLLDEDVM